MKTTRLIVAAVAASLACAASAAAFSAKDVTEPRVYTATDGTDFRYRWHQPATVEPGKKYPLVVLMHGAGERGTNNVSQLKWGANQILAYALKNGDCYFVAGQVPNGKRWVEVSWGALDHRMPETPSATMGAQIEFLRRLLADPKVAIDADRVYATGISMGGYGTWDLISRQSGWFAAAMPICGGGDVRQAWKLRDLPIWAYHGDQDTTVPFVRSRNMTKALWDVGGKIKYTEYAGVGHGSWGPAYGDEKNLAWLFAQRRVKKDRFPFQAGDRVAFLGDSITQNGVENKFGYVNLVVRDLAERGVKVDMIPAGVSGNVSRQMLARLEKDVLAKKPKYMFLSSGVNDAPNGRTGDSCNPGIPLANYAMNMMEIVQRAQAAGITVILLEPTLVVEEPDVANRNEVPYVEACRELGRRMKLKTIPLNRIFKSVFAAKDDAWVREYTLDGTHLNPAGDRIMADVILQELGWK